MAVNLAGKFIVLDGPDGCGKTTQCELLRNSLIETGIDTVICRDPGATKVGEKIRQLLLAPENVGISTATEALLYMAARVQLWTEKIAPALSASRCVIVDRWLSSTCAYQGFAGGFGIEKVIEIATYCLEKPWPDLTIVLDVDLKVGAARLNRELDRMEQKGVSYHQRVREGFLKLAAGRRDFAVIDAKGPIETVHREVLNIVSHADLR